MQSKKQVRTILVVLSLGVGYLIWLKLTDLALTRLDFKGAFQANPFLFVTGPLLLAELGYCFWRQRKREQLPRWNHAAVVIYGIALCIFGVFRNLV